MMKMLLTWRAREKSVAASSWPSSWQVLDREERNMWYLGDKQGRGGAGQKMQ